MASWHFSDGSEDPATTPFLEIADQKGNPIHIPVREKKVTESQLCYVLYGALQKYIWQYSYWQEKIVKSCLQTV